ARPTAGPPFAVVAALGRLAFNPRDAPSLWFEWMGRLADLTAAMPMWARETDAPLFRAIATWLLLAAGGGGGCVKWRGRLAVLTAAMPMWARETDAPLFRAIATWLLLAAAGWGLLRAADRHVRLRPDGNFQL